eukprot:m.20022 g.20022  ORF g.20022 m.20022 type:complete len:364 (+) comp27955_c0_seq2:227-1318(+)
MRRFQLFFAFVLTVLCVGRIQGFIHPDIIPVAGPPTEFPPSPVTCHSTPMAWKGQLVLLQHQHEKQVRLHCHASKGSTTSWKRNGKEITAGFILMPDGSLYGERVSKEMEAVWKCCTKEGSCCLPIGVVVANVTLALHLSSPPGSQEVSVVISSGTSLPLPYQYRWTFGNERFVGYSHIPASGVNNETVLIKANTSRMGTFTFYHRRYSQELKFKLIFNDIDDLKTPTADGRSTMEATVQSQVSATEHGGHTAHATTTTTETGARFAERGQSLNKSNSSVATSAPPSSSDDTKSLIIGLEIGVVVAVVICCLLIVVICFCKKKNSEFATKKPPARNEEADAVVFTDRPLVGVGLEILAQMDEK